MRHVYFAKSDVPSNVIYLNQFTLENWRERFANDKIVKRRFCQILKTFMPLGKQNSLVATPHLQNVIHVIQFTFRNWREHSGK